MDNCEVEMPADDTNAATENALGVRHAPAGSSKGNYTCKISAKFHRRKGPGHRLGIERREGGSSERATTQRRSEQAACSDPARYPHPRTCRSRFCYDYSPLIFSPSLGCVYIFLTSLAEGRLPEAFGGWSEGRPPRVGLATQHSGCSGHRAGRHYDRSARCSLGGSRLQPSGGLSGTTVKNGTAARANGSNEAAPQSPARS